MATKSAGSDPEELHSLLHSYLSDLDSEYEQQFANTPDKGQKYREEFLEFVRRDILLPSDWKDSTAPKKPFEVVSQFKELKIMELEKKIAAKTIAQTPESTVIQSTPSKTRLNHISDGQNRIFDEQENEPAELEIVRTRIESNETQWKNESTPVGAESDEEQEKDESNRPSTRSSRKRQDAGRISVAAIVKAVLASEMGDKEKNDISTRLMIIRHKLKLRQEKNTS